MPLADQCCGSAGVYNVTETEASLELLALKMEYAKESKAASDCHRESRLHSAAFAPAPQFMGPARKFCTWSNSSTGPCPTHKLFLADEITASVRSPCAPNAWRLPGRRSAD